jgi:DNA-binding response OmpR family regulator
MRILIVEDDPLLSAQFAKALTQKKYLVDTADKGSIAWQMIQMVEYDLVITDVMLPELDGHELCRQLRDRKMTVPVLMMTAFGDREDSVVGLDAGADDYLLKPISVSELYARVRALLRRGQVKYVESILRVGDLCVNPHAFQVTYLGKPFPLKPKEFAILELFLRNPQRLFSRTAMLEQLWSYSRDMPDELTVKSHIRSLRQRLRTIDMADLIETVYGMGYRLNSRYSDFSEQAQ